MKGEMLNNIWRKKLGLKGLALSIKNDNGVTNGFHCPYFSQQQQELVQSLSAGIFLSILRRFVARPKHSELM
ncbi:unnamed protein product [Brugia timori]|uniref:Uncharacterized protein n=1 Tax=Brugia timori TaxID=42155 RepID=A0A0R3Q6T8_9BILA|nr:unnamed protein product [Brugia timori]